MNTTAPFLPEDRQRFRSQSFTRAVFAIGLHEAGGVGTDIETFARATWEHDTRIARITRAAVLPTDTSATAIAAASVSDFIASLQPISGAARLIDASLRLRAPSGTNTIAVPWASDVTADFVAEGAPIPVQQGSISDITLTPSQKSALILSASNTLLGSTNGEAVLEAMLRRAAAQALDTALFGNTAGDTTRPPGLLAGVSATAATMTLGGDLMALADATVSGGGDGNILFFSSPGRVFSAQAQSLATLPIYASAAIANTRIIAVCASAFFAAIGAPQIRASREAIMHFEDTTPAQIGVTATPTFPIRSMFQIDATSLQIVLQASWGQAPGTVAYIDSPAW